MKFTLKKPPPHEPGSHMQYPGPNPNGPVCHRRTNRQSPGHPPACVPRTRLLFDMCITIPAFQKNVGGRANQGGQPSLPLASWHIPLLGSHQSLPQHPPVHWTAPAQKITGCHPATCIPLVPLGNTSLQSQHACQSPLQAHNSYN